MEGVIYRSPEQGDKVEDETWPTGPGHETGGRGVGTKGAGEKGRDSVRKRDQSERQERGSCERWDQDTRQSENPESTYPKYVGLHRNKREASPAPARNMRVGELTRAEILEASM